LAADGEASFPELLLSCFASSSAYAAAAWCSTFALHSRSRSFSLIGGISAKDEVEKVWLLRCYRVERPGVVQWLK